MRISRSALSIFLVHLFSTLTWADFGGPVPVGALAQRADLVVVAAIQQITDGTSTETVTLQVIRTLKGEMTSPSLLATIVSGARPAAGILSKSFVGARGVWFLRNNSGVNDVLPLFQGAFAGRELFIPVGVEDQSSAPTGTVAHQVLTYQLRWYQSVSDPGQSEDEHFIPSLIYDQGREAGDAIAALTSSVVLSQHVVGLIAGLRLGSPDALSQVADELDALRSGPRFNLVLLAIREYPSTQPDASIKALEKLIGLHSDIEGLDDAASTALARIGGLGTVAGAQVKMKAALPGMLLLLDSKDPNAQIRAARFFSYFAMFTDASGNVPGTGVTGPFATAERSQFDPTEGTSASPAQYGQFWKEWCAKNRKQLGF